MRALISIRSLFACTPQFMPDALLQTIPPTIALPIEAGSGGKTRPYGLSTRLTWEPTIPGCKRMLLRSSLSLYFSQCLPATISTESLTLCPDSDVPAARKVKGSLCLWQARTIRDTSSSSLARTTTLGINR